jgi:hypothetical protein
VGRQQPATFAKRVRSLRKIQVNALMNEEAVKQICEELNTFNSDPTIPSHVKAHCDRLFKQLAKVCLGLEDTVD